MKTFPRIILYLVLLLIVCIPLSTGYMSAQISVHSLMQSTNIRISGLDWSPDGTKIAIGVANGIDILDASSRNVIQSLTGATSTVVSVDWSPDGTKIAGASLDSVGVRIWSVSSGQIIVTLQPEIDSGSVFWSPDGTKVVATGFDTSVGVYDASTGHAVAHPQLSGSDLDWSPDGTKIVAASGYTSQVYIANVTNEQRILTLNLTTTSGAVDWSPDGTKIVTGSDDGNLKIWNASTGTTLFTMTGHTDIITSTAFNPDNRIVASSSFDKTVRFWDAQTGQSLGIIQNSKPVQVVAWSPDGSQLAYAGDEGVVRIVKPVNNGRGLRGQYFDNADVTTGLKFYRINPTIDFNWGTGTPDTAIAVDTFSIRWIGKVEPLYSETYTFYVTQTDGARLWINGQQLVNNWVNNVAAVEHSGTIMLIAGVKYDIKLEYFENTAAASVKLEWSSAHQTRQVIPASQLYAPEGQLAFTGRTSSVDEVFVMNPDGTGEINLSNNAAQDNYSAWSPDGTKVAFVSTRDGNEEIYMINADGTGLRRLTNSATSDNQPAWSPDGTKIAFTSARIANGRLYYISITGTGIPTATRLTNLAFGESNPMWSPNGTKLIYEANISSNPEIYVVAYTGTAQTPVRITNRGGIDAAPYWSPDGSKIALRSAFGSATDQIWVYDFTATPNPTLTKLTTLGANFFISWSPDGSKILFQSDRTGNIDIYTMDTSGANQTDLTNSTPSEAYAIWSPDARQIAYRLNGDIYVMNRDGGNVRQLTNTPSRTEQEIVWWQTKQTR